MSLFCHFKKNKFGNPQCVVLSLYFFSIILFSFISVSTAFFSSSFTSSHNSLALRPSSSSISTPFKKLLFATSLTSAPPAKAKASSDATGGLEEVDSKWCEEYAENLESLKKMSKTNEQKWIDHVKSLSHDELTLYRRKANARRDFLESEKSVDGSDDSSYTPEEEKKKIEKVLKNLGAEESLMESVKSKFEEFSTEVSETTVDGIALDGKIKVSFNLDREPIKVTIDPEMDMTTLDAESLALLVEQAMDNGHKKASMEFEKKWRNFKIKDSEMGNLNLDQMLGELI